MQFAMAFSPRRREPCSILVATSLFRSYIERQDRDGWSGMESRAWTISIRGIGIAISLMTSMALVQGDALGGGFEAALSAWCSSQKNLRGWASRRSCSICFLGMGAFSFLSRKVGRRVADELITSGMCIRLVSFTIWALSTYIRRTGTGEQAVYALLRHHAKVGNGRRGYERARNEVEPVSRDELMRVVNVWADTALKLTDRDMKMMERLVRAQHRTHEPIAADHSGIVVPIS